MDNFISLKIPIAMNRLSNQLSECAHHYHQIITDIRGKVLLLNFVYCSLSLFIEIAPNGKLSFPPGYFIMLFHLRMLYYNIYSMYPEIEDFLVKQIDLHNKATHKK
jgi:hypothetical protein